MKSNVQKRKSAARPTAPLQARPGRHLNALKHGLNSASVLLPGDNVTAFRRLRHREFRLFKPRNIEEARCVETIVAAHWRIERCRVEQQIFKQHLGAVLSGDPAVTGALVDADPHRLHHRGTDCGLEERRLEKSLREAKAELALLQKHRAQNLIVGRETELEDYTRFVAEGEPVMADGEPFPAEPGSTVAAREPAREGDESVTKADALAGGKARTTPPATPSHQGGISKKGKRDHAPPTGRDQRGWSHPEPEATTQQGTRL